MKKKTKSITEAWGDTTNLCFTPKARGQKNRAPWQSVVPDIWFFNALSETLSDTALRLWLFLNHRARTGDSVIASSYGLAKDMHRSRATITRAIADLKSAGMLETVAAVRPTGQQWPSNVFNVAPGRKLLLRMQDRKTNIPVGRDTDESWMQSKKRAQSARSALLGTGS